MMTRLFKQIIQIRTINHIFLLLLLRLFDVSNEVVAQDFWQQTNGPYIGVINEFAVTNSNHILAGTSRQGIFRSKDNGFSWTPLNNSLTKTSISSFAVKSNDHIYASAGSADTNGVFRSTDNGDSWTFLGLKNHQVTSIVIHPNGSIFAGTFLRSKGVLRSTDDGNSWTPVNNGLTDLNAWVLAINNTNGYIFAGTFGSGVFRSIDNGDNWMKITTGVSDLSSIMALTINANGDIFAGDLSDGVFRSMNNGDGWTKINNGLTNTRILSLAIKTNGDIFVSTDDGGVFRSTNNGDNWIPVNIGLTNFVVRKLKIIDSNGYILAGTDGGGVYRSTDNGNSWTPVNTGFTGVVVKALSINIANGHIFAGTGPGGIFRSTDNGGIWTRIFTSNYDFVDALAINSSGHIFGGEIGGLVGVIFRSTDNGKNWGTLFSSPLLQRGVDLIINSKGDIFAGILGGGVFRSNDNGDNWAEINAGLTNKDVTSLAINTTNSYVFAGTNGNGVFRSINNGDNWTQVNTGLTNSRVLSLAISSMKDYIFAGTNGGGIFRSIDNGDNWIPVNSDLTINSVDALAINSIGQVFAGSNEGGCFRSTDNGSSWIPVLTGLTNTHILSLVVNTNDYIFAGTNSGGVFRSVQSTLAPSVTTNPATGVTSTSAQLNGTVNPNGLNTAVKFEFGTTTNYDNTIAATPSPIIGTNQVVVAATISNLSSGKTYHYRVAATNSAGITNGADQTFTTPEITPIVITNAATNVGSTSATFNGTVNPNGLSLTVKFEYGLTTDYGSEITATPGTVIGTNSFSVSAAISNLTPLMDYHYRVVTIDKSDNTKIFNGPDQTFKTLNAAPTVTTNAATNVSSTSVTVNGTVNPNGVNTDVIFQYGETQNYGSKIVATPSPLTGIIPVAVSAVITGLLPDRTYHYRVFASNTTDTSYGADQTCKTTLPPLDPTMTLNKIYSFTARTFAREYKATDYRLVGLPGEGNIPVTEFVQSQGTQGIDWQIYWDNGDLSNDPNKYWIKLDPNAPFKFSIGRAYWLVSKVSVRVERTVPSPSLNADGDAIIPLYANGWNLITNPFNGTIKWDKIRAANNNITQPIYAYNGNYTTPNDFEPYIGYYFDNKDTKLPNLKVPYRLLFSGTAVVNTPEPMEWRVNISLSSGEFDDKATWFGIAKTAKSGFDRLDFRKPRSLASVPTSSFYRPKWDQNSRFATDIRPQFDEKEAWDFEVQSAQREELKLTFSGIERVPSQFEIFLIDEARSRYVSLREDSLYSFTPAADISKFTVLVGKAEAIKEQLETIPPKELSLGQNYPNPFNPLTAIPVSIPVTTEVKLKVYDILGKEVKTLYDGSLTLGRHFFHWDGRDERGNALATGVYIYRLTTSQVITFTKKMLFVK